MKFFSWVLISLLPVTAASGDELFSRPADIKTIEQKLAGSLGELRTAQVLKGDFVQLKHLHEFPQPLRSSGKFLFARGQGIYWHTQQPFDSEFVLTSTQMTVSDGGTVAQRRDTSQQPGLKVVSDIFLALFALDLPSLADHFELYTAGGSNPWQIGLRPKDAALRAVAREIKLSGHLHVERV